MNPKSIMLNNRSQSQKITNYDFTYMTFLKSQTILTENGSVVDEFYYRDGQRCDYKGIADGRFGDGIAVLYSGCGDDYTSLYMY